MDATSDLLLATFWKTAMITASHVLCSIPDSSHVLDCYFLARLIVFCPHTGKPESKAILNDSPKERGLRGGAWTAYGEFNLRLSHPARHCEAAAIINHRISNAMAEGVRW